MNEIGKVAVIGAGAMGAAIAAHVANAGVKVRLLDVAAADGAYRNAIARNAKNPASLNNLALLYQEAGDERALATAEQAFQLAPGHPIVLDTYGWLLVNNGQQEKGIGLLEQAAALAPSSKEIAEHLQQAKAKR